MRSLGNLGDIFPDEEILCRVRGCGNVWRFSGEGALRRVAEGQPARPERMCQNCYETFCELQDRQVACVTPNCTKTWLWTRYSQLEALAQGRKGEPRGFCAECQQKLQTAKPVEVPCRMKECGKIWSWSSRDQLLNATEKPSPRLCDDCYDTLRTLNDEQLPCSMQGCDRTWAWNRYQQLGHLLTGKRLAEPPKRMCQRCFAKFNELRDLEVPCCTEGCRHTWTFSCREQLGHLLAGKEAMPPADRLCRKCYGFIQHAVERHVPCQNRGCPNTWTYTKQEQLRDRIEGCSRPAPRLCDECREQVAGREVRAVDCMVPGCSGTWTYSPADQVRDLRAGKGEHVHRRCSNCEQFLAQHEAQAIGCSQCGKQMQWSSYQQLLCHLGTFVRPTRCSDCADRDLSFEKPEQPSDRAHHLVVKMPSSGPWQKYERISQWPPHLTHDVLAEAEQADVCIVAFGDDATFSSEQRENSWPYLLQQTLNATACAERRVVVINAGMPKSTSRHALIRYARDVAPFQPHLVLFSFLFADSLLWLNRQERTWHPNIETEEAAQATEALCRKLSKARGKALYWIPNSPFPDEYVGTEVPEFRGWVREQLACRDHCLRQARHFCGMAKIPIVDLHSRFEVNGTKSAKKWMCDWHNHNAVGARNIANWLAEYIRNENLLPPNDR